MRSREQGRKKTPITGGKKKLPPIDWRYWIVPCVAASCIYLQSLSFGFVADDYTQIVNNPQVHEFGGGFHMEGTKTSKRFRHPWSAASIGVSIGTLLVTTAIVNYRWHGRWNVMYGTWHAEYGMFKALVIAGLLSVLVSFILAIVAIVRERPPYFGILALLLSLFPIFSYAGG